MSMQNNSKYYVVYSCTDCKECPRIIMITSNSSTLKDFIKSKIRFQEFLFGYNSVEGEDIQNQLNEFENSWVMDDMYNFNNKLSYGYYEIVDDGLEF